MTDKTIFCNHCAKLNRRDVTLCAGCGLPLRGEPPKYTTESADKKSRLQFLLSRIAAVDFLHLHGH